MQLLWFLLVRAIYILLAWLSAKLGVETTGSQLDTTAAIVAGTIAFAVGIAIEKLAPKLWAWLKERGATAILLLLLAAGGCKLTPTQLTKVNELEWAAVNQAAGAAAVAGELPEPARTDVTNDLLAWGDRIDQAWAWLSTNPQLADIPGVVPPSLDKIDMIRSALARRGVSLRAMLAPELVQRSLPPATQPAIP